MLGNGFGYFKIKEIGNGGGGQIIPGGNNLVYNVIDYGINTKKVWICWNKKEYI